MSEGELILHEIHKQSQLKSLEKDEVAEELAKQERERHQSMISK